VTVGAGLTGNKIDVKTIGNIAVNSVSSIWLPSGAVIRNASTVAMNKISKSTAASSTLTSLSAGQAGNAVNTDVVTSPDSISLEKTKKVALSALAASGLNSAEAAELTARVNAVNVGGFHLENYQ
jgi:hypothetical protein